MTEGIAAAPGPRRDTRRARRARVAACARGGRPRVARARRNRARESVADDRRGSIVRRGRRDRSATVLSTIVHDEPGQAGQLLVLKLATTIGSDERAIRAPSAIAVALAAGLLVILGTMLLGRVAGVVAGIALAANAGVVEASREARPVRARAPRRRRRNPAARLRARAGRRLAVGCVRGCRGAAAAHAPARRVGARGPRRGADRTTRPGRPADAPASPCSPGRPSPRCLLAWMAADRLDALRRLGALDVEGLGTGLARAGGWNPCWPSPRGGVVVLFGARRVLRRAWVGVLVAALIAAPVAATSLAAVALPVHAGALVLCAPGVALAAGAVALLLSPTRGLVVGRRRRAAVRVGDHDHRAADGAGRRGLARPRGRGEAREGPERDGRRPTRRLTRGARLLRAGPLDHAVRPGRRSLDRRRRGRCRGAIEASAPAVPTRAMRCSGSSATATGSGCSTGFGRRGGQRRAKLRAIVASGACLEEMRSAREVGGRAGRARRRRRRRATPAFLCPARSASRSRTIAA